MISASGMKWFQENQSRFSGQILFNEPLSKYTYYRIGGPAAVLAIPKDAQDILWLAEGIRETGIPFFVLGQGSNLLVSDLGYSGLVVRANRLNLQIDAIEDGSAIRLRTGGSVAISTLLRRAAQEGWAGLEFLTGVPGSVGGAVRMNAGTHLGETCDRLLKVEAYPLLGEGVSSAEVQIYEGNSLQFQYRKNLFLPKGSLVWATEWWIERKEPATVKALIDETLTRRKATQPIDYPSCGSVFKNPKASGVSAWQVIDRLGLRGHRIGNAQFAEKHSNFIINLGGAQASEVKALIDLAKARAQAEMGIVLEEEVIYLGG
jgi:UDP-N-acetylmuramate dehydrogenase